MTDLGQPRPRIYKSQKMVDEEVVWKFDGPDPNPYHREWQVLLDAIRQDKRHNESRSAAEADLAAIMGRMATHTGAYITWEQALKSDVQLMPDIDRVTFDTPAPLQAGPDGIYPCPQPGDVR
jgi:hypothetical protein